MKNIVIGLLALTFSVAGFAADPPAPPEIKPPSNGEEWLKLSSAEKLYWSLGYAQSHEDSLERTDAASGPSTPCANLAVRTTSGKLSGLELVSGLERFYSEPANTVIPVGTAVRVVLLQSVIQELIDTARVPDVQAAADPNP